MRTLVIVIWGVAIMASIVLPQGRAAGFKLVLWFGVIALTCWWCWHAIRTYRDQQRQSQMQQQLMVAQMLASKNTTDKSTGSEHSQQMPGAD